MIKSPILRHEEEYSFMECDVIVEGKIKKLYYSTPKEFSKYLAYERTDSFLLAIFQYAMIKGENIFVEGSVSEKLYYNLVTHVIPLLASALGHHTITITCKRLDKTKYDEVEARPNMVGTGCSLGVDSFATILYHTSENVPDSYRVNCLTLFNVGAYGNSMAKSTASFNYDEPLAREYSKYKSLPLVTLSSNIGTLYEGGVNFELCHHTRNIGAVLALQKYFTKYIYASSYPTTGLRLSHEDPSHFESALVPYFSTENTEISIGLPSLNRTDKTKYISAFPETYRRLYVCLQHVLKNDYDSYSLKNETQTRNCSSCEKCKRTMLALDVLNQRENYSSVFDWRYYDTQRSELIGYVLANKNRKGKDFYKELCHLMDEEHFQIPISAKWFQCKYRFFYFIHRPKLIKF